MVPCNDDGAGGGAALLLLLLLVFDDDGWGVEAAAVRRVSVSVCAAIAASPLAVPLALDGNASELDDCHPYLVNMTTCDTRDMDDHK